LPCGRELLQESGILRPGGNTRKFKTTFPHGPPFERRKNSARFRTCRSLCAAGAAALLLAGGLVPRADAVLVTYFNFEDSFLGGPVDTTSDAPGVQSSTLTIDFGGTIPPPVSVGGLTGMNSNIAPGDTDPNRLAMGFEFTKDVAPAVDITFSVNTIGLTNLSLSFAINNTGNGFTTATFSYSLDGTTFTTVGGPVTLPPPPGSTQIVTFNYPTAVDNQPIVYFRVSLTGGMSEGVNLQSVVDNIQLNAIPEPATTIGGILGVGGLCWYRRRWLIRFLRFRRA
jgi:hypothetical protein